MTIVVSVAISYATITKATACQPALDAAITIGMMATHGSAEKRRNSDHSAVVVVVLAVRVAVRVGHRQRIAPEAPHRVRDAERDQQEDGLALHACAEGVDDRQAEEERGDGEGGGG